MLTKNDEIFNSYDIGLLLFILLLDMTQYLDLNEGLLAEFGVVFDNLESRFQFGFMVQDFEYLSVRALADNREHLVSIGNVIIFHKSIFLPG